MPLTPKVAQLMAEASKIEIMHEGAGPGFIAGFFACLQLADRHPEAVGLLVKAMANPDGSPMPPYVHDEGVARADRIALAVEDGRGAKDRLADLLGL